MTHLRLVCPRDLVERVLAYLHDCASCVNVVRLEHAATKPIGDLILCDVTREDASRVIGDLERIGLGVRGSIAIEEVEGTISLMAAAAEAHAPGSPADAVVWEELATRTEEITELSISFVVLIVVATLIAAAGVINDSVVLIIGAMVVGPEFGPLAGIALAAVRRQPRLARRSALALACGFPLAIAAAYVGTLLVRAVTLAPDTLEEGHEATLFISTPNGWSVGVALLAGIAGMISISTAKSAALIGVLISVTTIPAAANVGVAAAYRDWSECVGAALQLAINLLAILLSAVATLALQRAAYMRRARSA